MFFLIGIDDTDNITSQDTGSLAQLLGQGLDERGFGRLISVTSHQLFHHSNVHYTTQNQCACLLMDADEETRRDIELFSREFLLRESAVGANAGFALSAWNRLPPSITAWGDRAKTELLSRQEAMALARECKISIAGFTGSGTGVIGALAALGLYYKGNDGRYLWLPGLSDLKGIFTYTRLIGTCPIDRVENSRGRRPLPNDRIYIGDAAYPILRDGKSVLLIELAKKDEPFEWSAIVKEKAIHLSS